MKEKVTNITLTLGLILSLSYNLHLHNDNVDINNKMQEMNKNIKAKSKIVKKQSAEIANLADIIKKQDEKLKNNNMVIEKQNKQLQEDKNEIKNLKAKVKEEEEEKTSSFKVESKGSEVNAKTLNLELTAYTATDGGISGITKTGYDVRNTIYYQGMRIIATDASYIPLYSILDIKTNNGYSFRAISIDTGSAIQNNIVDFLVSSQSEAINFGRQQATAIVVRWGKG